MYISPKQYGEQLLLGAHKNNRNDFELKQNKSQSNKRGRPRQNNGYFEGLFMKVTQRILCWNEIFVDYSFNQMYLT